MELPRKIESPFFAYGLFKPGQLGFLRLREFIRSSELNRSVRGTLLERDGLPILNKDGTGTVKGDLLFFYADSAVRAYESIAEIEPDKHYWWGTTRVRAGGDTREANVLFGKKPDKGSAPIEKGEWNGEEDPLFCSALELVRETLDQNEWFEWDFKPFFRLQMAYLLLWSAIERYTSLRYHLGDKATGKVKQLAKEDAFAVGLLRVVSEPREIYRADRPGKKEKLDPSDPEKSIDYYYQVRSNIVHRGKAARRDFDTLLWSLKELHEIFRDVLESAFKDARGYKQNG